MSPATVQRQVTRGRRAPVSVPHHAHARAAVAADQVDIPVGGAMPVDVQLLEHVEAASSDPGAWMGRARAVGQLSAAQFLAVVLRALQIERQHGSVAAAVVRAWAAELGRAVAAGEISPCDPVTALPLHDRPGTWTWSVPVCQAEQFVAARCQGWRIDGVLAAWLSELPSTPAAASAQTPAERQRSRYEACVAAGLSMPVKWPARLPNGIGKVATRLGIERQSLSADVISHIQRMQSASS